MGVNIVDPLTSNAARVNARSSLLSDAVTRSDFVDAMLRGDAYDVELNDVNVGADTEIGLMYIMNSNQNAFLVINALFLSFGIVTGGVTVPPATGLMDFRVIKSASTGTLISAGTELTPVNRNIGSGKIASGTFLGNTGISTVTDGTTLFKQEFTVTDPSVALIFPLSISPFFVDIALSPNQAVAFAVTPVSGTTAQIVNIGVQFNFTPLDTFRTANI